ncbi:MAG: hypothetical protein EP330_26945 [Deltaproteobacteria bacterium]|nr:MAG: hypothetical protein EP330_26945 [Deltaproteobacteria bacterium]
MHDPVREGLIRPIPEEPWWWPLGPTGFLIGMLGGVLWFSQAWPLPIEVLEALRSAMRLVLVVLGVSWLGLAVWLRRRRHRWLHEPMWVVVDAAGLTLDGRQLAWQQLSACEWSPFGLVFEVDGRREHFQARVTDAQAERLNDAVSAFSA